MIALWSKLFIQKCFSKNGIAKSYPKKNLSKESWEMTSGTTKWEKLGQVEYVGQVGQGERGLQILVWQVGQGEVSSDLRGTSGTRTRGLSTWTIPLVPNGATRPWNSSTNVYVSYEHNENWFFTYIVSYTLIGSYMSAFMYAPGHHWPDISKMQPLDLDHGLSEGTGVV